jgi:hypothetical protein
MLGEHFPLFSFPGSQLLSFPLFAAGVYLPEGRQPIIPLFQHSIISIVSAANYVHCIGIFILLQAGVRAITRRRMKTKTTELRSIEGRTIPAGGSVLIFKILPFSGKILLSGNL